MASFSENHKNWIKVTHGLVVVKRTLIPFIEREFKAFHQQCQRNCGLTVCTNCNASAVNNNTISCPNYICDQWVNEIRNQASGRLCWTNCDLQSLPTNYWELAKVFMGRGQKTTNTGPNETDTSNLLIAVNQCKHFSSKVTKVILEKVIGVRNKMFHAAHQELDEPSMNEFFSDMQSLLMDSTLSYWFPEAIEARPQLIELSSTNFAVTLEHEQRAYTELLDTMTCLVSQILGDIPQITHNIPQMTQKLDSCLLMLNQVMTAVKTDLQASTGEIQKVVKESEATIKTELARLEHGAGENREQLMDHMTINSATTQQFAVENTERLIDHVTRNSATTQQFAVENTERLIDHVTRSSATTQQFVQEINKKIDGNIIDDLREALRTHYQTMLQDMGAEPVPYPAYVILQAAYVNGLLSSGQQDGDQMGLADTTHSRPSEVAPAPRRILVENKLGDTEKCTLALKLVNNWVNDMVGSEAYPIPILLNDKQWEKGDSIYDNIVKQLLGDSWLHRTPDLKKWMLQNQEKALVIYYSDNTCFRRNIGAVCTCNFKIIHKDLPKKMHLLVTSTPHFSENTKGYTDVYGFAGLGHSTSSNHKGLFSFVRKHTSTCFDSQERDSQQLDAIFLKLGKHALAMIQKTGKWNRRNQLSFDIQTKDVEAISLIGIVQRTVQNSGQKLQFTHAAFEEFLAAKFLSETSSEERKENLRNILPEPNFYQVLRLACNLATADPEGALKDMFEVWNELMPSRKLMQYIYQEENDFLHGMSIQEPWHQLSHIPFVWLLEINNEEHKKALVQNILEHIHAIYCIASQCNDCIDGIRVFFEVANTGICNQHIDIYVDPRGEEEKLEDVYQAVAAFQALGTLYIRDSNKNTVALISDEGKSKVTNLVFDESRYKVHVGRGSVLTGLRLRDPLDTILEMLGSGEDLERLHIYTRTSSTFTKVLGNFISGCSSLKDFALKTHSEDASVENIWENLTQNVLRLHLYGVTFGEEEKHLVRIFQNSKMQALRIQDLTPYDENIRRKVLQEGLPRLTSLEELSLSLKYQSILDVVAPLIPSFEKLQSLVLRLSKVVRLSGVASGIGKSKSLCKLVLVGESQHVTEEEAKELTECLQCLENLFVFSIEKFNLSKGNGLSIIAKGIGKHVSLAMISFINCYLDDILLSEITDMLASNTRIQSLTIHNDGWCHDQDSNDTFVKSLKGRARMCNLYVSNCTLMEEKLNQYRLSNSRINF